MIQTDNKVKFYADCPDGTINKLFVFKDIKTLDHAKDIVIKYVRKGYIVRAAFYEFKTILGTMQNVKINGIDKIDLIAYKTFREKDK
jgi:hypothetical protein